MRAVILSIGSELTDGFLTDTNAPYLARELAALGIDVVGVTQVGDNLDHIVTALRRAWEDAQLIVTTGGLGPTADDLTREAIAHLLGETPAVDPQLLDIVSSFFSARGRPMTDENRKQAWLIPSATALPNPVGTAPGWFVERDDHVIISMPGVPREMTRMWIEQAVPRILPRLGDRVIVSKTLKTIGIGESDAEHAIRDIVDRGAPIVATYAKDDGVHIRITERADDRSTAEKAVAATETEIRAILGRYIYAEEPTTLGAALLEPVAAAGLTLALTEAGSDGRLTSMLADEPVAETCFTGGLVMPFARLAAARGIDAGAADAPRQLAAEEAMRVRLTRPADLGLVVAVRVTPTPGAVGDTGTADMAFAFARQGTMREHQQRLTAAPEEIRRRVTLWAAEFLRDALLGTDTKAIAGGSQGG